jgi:hypothetical protein
MFLAILMWSVSSVSVGCPRRAGSLRPMKVAPKTSASQQERIPVSQGASAVIATDQ